MWLSLRSDKAAIAEFDRMAGAAFWGISWHFATFRGGRFARIPHDALQ